MIIFVFGSNREGRHGAGAALQAKRKWGAIYGQSEGLQGQSYAIVTKELRPNKSLVTLKEIEAGITKFLQFAISHPEHTFIVSPVGCGLAGFRPSQIGPFFKSSPKNVKLPDSFLPYSKGLDFDG